MTADEYRDRRDRLNLTPGDAHRLFNIDDRTERRWSSGERPVPGTVERIFDLYEALTAARRFIVATSDPRYNYPRVLKRIDKALLTLI